VLFLNVLPGGIELPDPVSALGETHAYHAGCAYGVALNLSHAIEERIMKAQREESEWTRSTTCRYS
jgi:hypothetical protein